MQFAREGIRVNALCPGPVNTPLLQELFAKDPERAARRLVHVPMGRFAEAEEIAAAVAFLASDDSSFITASDFLVDGGIAGPTSPRCDGHQGGHGGCHRGCHTKVTVTGRSCPHPGRWAPSATTRSPSTRCNWCEALAQFAGLRVPEPHLVTQRAARRRPRPAAASAPRPAPSCGS